MEITEVKVTQKRVKAYHETTKYAVEYNVTLGENNQYQDINGTIKALDSEETIAYINKSWELSIRVVNGKEDLFMEVSQLTMDTLALLDEEIKKL